MLRNKDGRLSLMRAVTLTSHCAALGYSAFVVLTTQDIPAGFWAYVTATVLGKGFEGVAERFASRGKDA